MYNKVYSGRHSSAAAAAGNKSVPNDTGWTGSGWDERGIYTWYMGAHGGGGLR